MYATKLSNFREPVKIYAKSCKDENTSEKKTKIK